MSNEQHSHSPMDIFQQNSHDVARLEELPVPPPIKRPKFKICFQKSLDKLAASFNGSTDL